ncbi:potassium channel family protein [Sulfurimonas autotrophica]|uniref:TrkA-N domain protein n=1 Tax=Sulfurimonas autotrophica (strain ATCC BAA-671 / DSM 16294 / JCM 11897 / OK10) TaxID=563040 RepID=E0USF9_SULAO|nr:potassium channel protein [Sulfurimonas autotrophica]ADN09122.1 TrkA-N domain protein [Sulfurimonas autotrophica DSM 16294]
MNEQIIWIVLKRLRTPFLVIIITFAISILGLVLIPGTDNNGNPYQMTFFDAFYFVTYMASTIGFGEAPYTFNYEQRMWVSFAVYFTVIGWFYGIGAIVSLIQDEALRKALSTNSFRNQVKHINKPFYIILGYNSITKSIIDRLNGRDYRVVVLDKDDKKIDELILENFYPDVPAFVGDATNQKMLKIAGIHQKNCAGIISLFEDDMVNSKIATISKLLNKKLDIIVKATSQQQLEHFRSMDLKHVKNPFDIISKRIYYGITAPHIWLLEMWMYGHILKLKKRDHFPQGKYIIYGNGRMGKAIKEGLEKAGVEYVIKDFDSQKYIQDKNTTIFGDDDDMESLLKLGVKESSCIIAATQNDLLNLTILNKAKQLNPKIFTMARENALDDLNIFQASKINKIYIVEKILADATYNYIARPLADLFIQEARKKDDEWAEVIVHMLNNITGMNPMYFETRLNDDNAYALTLELQEGENITLADLRRSRADRNELLHIVFLLLKRGDEVYLMPDSRMKLEIGDELLIVSDEENYDDFEYIVNNIYELEYVLGCATS